MSKIQFMKVDPNAKIPQRAYETDAGMDLFSAEAVTIPPHGGRRMVSTGLRISFVPDKINFHSMGTPTVPYVWYAEVCPRSGMAIKSGVTVINTPGTIDQAYDGIVKVLLVNHDERPYDVNVGDRIAQLIITKSYFLPIEEVEEFTNETSRGEGGFGSTGQ